MDEQALEAQDVGVAALGARRTMLKTFEMVRGKMTRRRLVGLHLCHCSRLWGARLAPVVGVSTLDFLTRSDHADRRATSLLLPFPSASVFTCDRRHHMEPTHIPRPRCRPQFKDSIKRTTSSLRSPSSFSCDPYPSQLYPRPYSRDISPCLKYTQSSRSVSDCFSVDGFPASSQWDVLCLVKAPKGHLEIQRKTNFWLLRYKTGIMLSVFISSP